MSEPKQEKSDAERTAESVLSIVLLSNALSITLEDAASLYLKAVKAFAKALASEKAAQ